MTTELNPGGADAFTVSAVSTAQQALARALGMLGHRTVYWAGAGGFDPQASSAAEPLAIGREWPKLPAEQQVRFRPIAVAAGLDVDDPTLVAPACDCSGFVCWALGISRRGTQGGDAVPAHWVNTDSIWADATGAAANFSPLSKARPGCLVVYPQAGSGERYGHVALVTEVAADGRASRIVHCSAINFGTPPADAVKHTTPEAFERQPRSTYAWFRPLR